MSLAAMTWAVEAPIERPTAKLALVCLADHADADGTCFPSQKALAAKVGVSERALRDALTWLEQNEYIERTARHRKDGSRTSDAYQLPAAAYRQNFPAPRKQTTTPPAKSAGLTTFEPVTEPVTVVVGANRFDDLQSKLFKAAGFDGFHNERNPSLLNFAPVLGLLDAGFDLEREILPTIEAKAKSGFVFRSWSLLPNMVTEFAEKRRGAAATPRAASKPVDWAGRINAFAEDETWIPAWGPRPGEPGCGAPAELIAKVAA